MKSFTRRSLIWDGAAALAVAALSYGAYLAIPSDSENFGGLGISARGTINSIDPAMRMVNISHEPVKALNTQAMQMDFGVAPGVDLNSLKVGTKVVFTLSRREGDLYVIDAIKPTM
jgi:Cu/Ag efflux protein CusF